MAQPQHESTQRPNGSYNIDEVDLFRVVSAKPADLDSNQTDNP